MKKIRNGEEKRVLVDCEGFLKSGLQVTRFEPVRDQEKGSIVCRRAHFSTMRRCTVCL